MSEENWKDWEEDKRVDCWKVHSASVPPLCAVRMAHTSHLWIKIRYSDPISVFIKAGWNNISSFQNEMKVKLKTLEAYFENWIAIFWSILLQGVWFGAASHAQVVKASDYYQWENTPTFHLLYKNQEEDGKTLGRYLNWHIRKCLFQSIYFCGFI